MSPSRAKRPPHRSRRCAWSRCSSWDQPVLDAKSPCALAGAMVHASGVRALPGSAPAAPSAWSSRRRRCRAIRTASGTARPPARSSSSDRPRSPSCPATLVLRHRDLGVGEGGDLGQVGDDEHLVVVAESGQRPADRDWRPRRRCRRRPRRTRAWAGRCVAPFEQHEAQRQHGAGQLAARRHLGERQRRRPGVGGQQERDVVAGIVLADLDREPALAWPARASSCSTAAPASGAARAPGRADQAASAASTRSTAAARSRVERGGRAARSPRARPGGRAPRRGNRARRPGSRRTCGAGRAGAGAAPAPRPAARGRRSMRSPGARSSAADVGQLGRDRCAAGLRLASNGRRPVDGRDGRRPARRARRRRRAARATAAAAASRWATASASTSSSASRRSSSSGSSSWRALELVDLEAQQVDLAGPGPLVAAELGQRGVDARRPRARAARERREVDCRRSGRARRAASAGASSDWWACWPWRSTSRSPQLGQRSRRWPGGRRRRPATGPRRAPPG